MSRLDLCHETAKAARNFRATQNAKLSLNRAFLTGIAVYHHGASAIKPRLRDYKAFHGIGLLLSVAGIAFLLVVDETVVNWEGQPRSGNKGMRQANLTTPASMTSRGRSFGGLTTDDLFRNEGDCKYRYKRYGYAHGVNTLSTYTI